MTDPGEPREEAASIRRSVPPSLLGLVHRITCYDGDGAGGGNREMASFVVPIIFSFADPLRIAFDRAPTPGDRIGSFVSGPHAGYVEIAYGGPVSCLQIDLTPIGAGLFFRRPLTEFTTRLVRLEDVEDQALNTLHERLASARTRAERLGIAAALIERRMLGHAVHPETAFIWSEIQRSRGAFRIGGLTEDVGWSGKRLAAHARDAFGMTPKRLARIARFRHAVDLAQDTTEADWAGLAVECGYADQTHLVREFVRLAGQAPEWRGGAASGSAEQICNTESSIPP